MQQLLDALCEALWPEERAIYIQGIAALMSLPVEEQDTTELERAA